MYTSFNIVIWFNYRNFKSSFPITKNPKKFQEQVDKVIVQNKGRYDIIISTDSVFTLLEDQLRVNNNKYHREESSKGSQQHHQWFGLNEDGEDDSSQKHE